MDDLANSTENVPGDVPGGAVRYYKRDFWSQENLKFVQPHFRLEKAAKIINRIARGQDRDLLDVGCGPAALMHILPDNIHYYGIDIAIHNPQATNLIETDFVENPIRFGEKSFDIVLAQGVFEYIGTVQSQKFSEISQLLNPGGKFVVSYWNFGHINKHIYQPFSNVQSFNVFRESLARYFTIDRFFPASHNWHHHGPGRRLVKATQMHLNVNIPLISPAFAVEYFFICSPQPAQKA